MSSFAKGNGANTGNWVSLGPFNSARGGVNSTPFHYGEGRVNVVAVDPNNPNTYYVGAPAGVFGNLQMQELTGNLLQIICRKLEFLELLFIQQKN